MVTDAIHEIMGLGTKGVQMVILGTAMGRALCVIGKMRGFSTLIEALDKMARSRWVMMELLLT